MSIRILEPRAIEQRSMHIIKEELSAQKRVLPQEELDVLCRVIHTTADFDYAKNLAFLGGAVEAGVCALQAATPIITDTNMAKAGISRPALAQLNSTVHCYVKDGEVAQEAQLARTTRAVMAMRKALGAHPQAILAVGNAPTALFELCEQMRSGARPALVIAVPVGFVNVVESKEETLTCCQELGIPAIIAKGRKGGSTVAAAIVNALAYKASGMR